MNGYSFNLNNFSHQNMTEKEFSMNYNQQHNMKPPTQMNKLSALSGVEKYSQNRSKLTLTPVLRNGDSVYQVKFKKGLRYFLAKPDCCIEYQIDDVVIVEADRGEDIGVVSGIFTAGMYCEARRQNSIRCGLSGVKEEEGSWDLKFINRYASLQDMRILTSKTAEEAAITQRAREIAYRHYNLPIKIIDVEFQYDRNKLTVIYESNLRVDFRDFVRELFSIYKVRIWMQQVECTDPNIDVYASQNEPMYPSIYNDKDTLPNVSPTNRYSPIHLAVPMYSLNNVLSMPNTKNDFQF